MAKSILRSLLLPAAAAALVACGGGGGGSSGLGPLKLAGVVAVGAPLPDAKVDIYESTGLLVETTTTAEDGSYAVTLPANVKLPLVVKAVKDEIALFSPVTSVNVSRVNVTPITNIIAAQLSPSGNPAELVQQIKAGTVVVDQNKIDDIVQSINLSLDPLLKTTNASKFDHISGNFEANGSGYDQALNALNISINPAGASSNIIVTVKVASDKQDALPEIKFSSNEKPPVLPVSIDVSKLPQQNIDSKIQNFLSRLDACYKIPVADRVQGDSVVKAPECKALFYNDNPATFKNNGSTVGKNKAWAGLWNTGAVNVKFSSGTYLYLEKSGDILVSWRSESPGVGVTYSRTWLRSENGVLKAYGNQYDYPFSVKPISESRNSVNTNKSYYSTGFDVFIANITDRQGMSIFDRVIVSSPNGRKTELKPQQSLSYLAIVGTSTSVIRLAGKFWDSSLQNRRPRELTENLIWAKDKNDMNADWSSEDIKSIPNIGPWKAEFFLRNNTSSQPDAVQTTIVTTRPLTVEEVSQRAFVNISDDLSAEIVKISSDTGYVQLDEGERAEVVGPGDSDAWFVPEGALSPTLLKVSGHYSENRSIRWDDSLQISTRQRKGSVECTRQTDSDAHCSSTTDKTYSNKARADLLQFFAWDLNEMQWSSFFTIYKTDFKK